MRNLLPKENLQRIWRCLYSKFIHSAYSFYPVLKVPVSLRFSLNICPEVPQLWVNRTEYKSHWEPGRIVGGKGREGHTRVQFLAPHLGATPGVTGNSCTQSLGSVLKINCQETYSKTRAWLRSGGHQEFNNTAKGHLGASAQWAWQWLRMRSASLEELSSIAWKPYKQAAGINSISAPHILTLVLCFPSSFRLP